MRANFQQKIQRRSGMRFELLGELGEGAMGVVFKARDLQTGSIVALKELDPEMGFPEREVLLARRVTHPNVCRLYDLFREDGRVYISMEYVEGQTLKKRIADAGALPADRALGIARQIVNGVEEAHRQGVIHRDLKPANIMVTQGGAVKLMDFGLAKGPEPDLTRDVVGSPAYMAPEQLHGDPADERSDIYTLGFILYEMLAGKRPSRKLPGPLPAGVPDRTARAILRCLERAPERRFRSAGELREALSEKPADAAAVRRANGARRRAAGLLAAGLLAAAGLATFSPRPSAENVQAPPAIPAGPVLAVLIDGDIGEDFRVAFVRHGKFRVVERGDLEKVAAELRLHGTSQELGRLLGAEYLVFGSSQRLGGKVRINARLVKTETGEILAADGRTGEAASSAELVDQLVDALSSVGVSFWERPARAALRVRV